MARYGAPQKPRQVDDQADRTSTKTVTIVSRVTPQVRLKLNTAAAQLGVSASALMCELIERMETDESGRPGFESKYAPSDDAQPTLEMTA